MHFFESRLLAELVLQTFGRTLVSSSLKKLFTVLMPSPVKTFSKQLHFARIRAGRSWLVNSTLAAILAFLFSTQPSWILPSMLCNALMHHLGGGLAPPCNCLFIQRIDAQICFYIVYKSVLSVFTQEFSLVVWLLMCNRKTNPKKIGQCQYFWVFRTDPKK